MGLPTGEQHRLVRDGRSGRVEAVVTELGASLRSLRVGGVALVKEYPDDLAPPGAAGVVLVPWPNRVAGATWLLDGAPQHLDITERDTGNASHGLLRNTGYASADSGKDSVTLTASVFPQHGYPFLLRTQVSYALTDDGLDVTHTVTHAGPGRAPVALGTHPYLCVGDTPTDDLSLTVVADTYLETDERSIPVRRASVEGTGFDLRSGHLLAGRHFDTAFTDLGLVDGCHRHRLVAPDGTGVELWADEAFGYVQVFHSRVFTGLDGPTAAVAIEPMTAPANAFNTGEGVRWLGPGETWSLSWGIRRTLG